MARMMLPSGPVLNKDLIAEQGQPVVKLEVIPIAEGETLTVRFKGTSSEWRQGIWLGVEGELEVAGARGDQFEIWTDTAPPSFAVKVLKTEDGLLAKHFETESDRLGTRLRVIRADSS